MARLAVMAHYDPTGEIGPHVARQAEALAEGFDDLVIVSTAPLGEASRQRFRSIGRLIERENAGYDFFSYRAGLAAQPLTAYDEVAICNDTYVGPLRDYRRILAEMEQRPAGFWGLTETDRVAHHVQSFFVAFRPEVLASDAFGRFWSDMVPLDDRRQVIQRYEVGLSRRLYEAGFSSAPYFVENEADRRIGRRRVRWWAAHRGPLRSRTDLRRVRRQLRVPWNPSIGLADRALEDGRLPYVKIDTLRYDPYGLGADRLLTLCEERFPAAFAGVRDFLERTARHYPPRAGEQLRPTPALLRPLRRSVAYTAPRGSARLS